MKVRIEKPMLKSLAMVASIIEARDAYTGGHLWRVSRYCHCLADTAGLPGDMAFLARMGGFLHDIGKVGIPDDILRKRGELTPEQFEVVKTHPGIGATLIQAHPLAELAMVSIHQHHEWVNGTGYPNRLTGERISDLAKIVSIADAFDALTSTRPYRKGGGAEAALSELMLERETQFDSQFLDIFAGMVRRGDLAETVGCSEAGLPLVTCPTCGPVIPVTLDARDGDVVYCRVCGSCHILHKKGDTFEVEPTGQSGSAEQLKPKPEMSALEILVSEAPGSIRLKQPSGE